jgi:nucleotide-binding universal stress UspA family protein
MTPKIIFVPFNGHDHELAALETSFNLAKKWKAHVAVWHALPNPEEIMVTYSSFVMGAPYFPDESSYRELLKLNEKSRQETLHKFIKTAKKAGIHCDDYPAKSAASASFHTTVDYAEKIIRTHGLLADLIIITRGPEQNMLYDEIIHSALFDTGRPVLFVPPGNTAHEWNEKTLIAWNGSREAIHAITAALPFLTSGNVKIMTGESDHWASPEVMPHDLAEYLGKHDIHAETLLPWVNSSPVANVILNSAKKLNAGLIVMGAYSHSRMREMIMGGVTAHMLKHADVPVLMMH